MRLADEAKSHHNEDAEICSQIQEDYSIVQTELTRLRAALDELDRLDPDDFKTGQEHLTPAFREVQVRPLMLRICTIVNKVLHNTDAYGNPLP